MTNVKDFLKKGDLLGALEALPEGPEKILWLFKYNQRKALHLIDEEGWMKWKEEVAEKLLLSK